MTRPSATTVAALYERDTRVIAPIEALRFSPLAITRAQGCHITDTEGRDLLDLSASWSAATVGYAHPAPGKRSPSCTSPAASLPTPV